MPTIATFCGKQTAAASGSQDPMIDVISVKPVEGFKLRVAFSDGAAGVRDCSATVRARARWCCR
jgi:hypothetical protein